MEAVAIISIASVLIWFIIGAKNQANSSMFFKNKFDDEDKK